jgi:cytochrome c oxidase cbb3-type subunit III
MSDFTSNFWPYLISFITVGGIVGCLALLFSSSKMQQMSENDDSTGHVYDDIVELNNPLPKWWMYLFVITCIFGFIYLAAYPGLGTYKGFFGWTAINQYEQENLDIEKRLANIYSRFSGMNTAELASDSKAMAIGERLFMNNCAQCHGSDAHGSKGFPNLTDNDWLHGGSPTKIEETITNGRIGMMPPMAAVVGTPDDVKNVANYVLSLSGSIYDSGRAGLGKEKFAACAACHGADAKGNQDIGSPNLTDNTWLHGAGEAAIIKRINEGKHNVMPAWKDKFTPAQIHVLAAYVWNLSNISDNQKIQSSSALLSD